MHTARPGDTVVLLRDMPQRGLAAGDTGTVRGVQAKPAPAYEVEFRARDPSRPVRVRLKPGHVSRTPLSPFDPMPTDGHSLYF